MIDVYVDYKATDSSCVNTAMKVEFEMFIKADGLSVQQVKFAKGGSSDWKNKIRLSYNNASGDIIERRFNIKPSDITAFYNNNVDGSKTAKSNPRLIIKIKQVGYHNSDYFRGYFGGVGDADKTVRTQDNAFDKSDTIKLEIPLNLPNPSADLSLSGTSPIAYNCKPTLSWTVNDVSSCSANGGWSGSLDKSNGTHTKKFQAESPRQPITGFLAVKNLARPLGLGLTPTALRWT